MAHHFSLNSILLALAITLAPHSNHIRAMEGPQTLAQDPPSLIEKTCTETLEPQLCSQCLTSEHTRRFDDPSGFLHSLLTCMNSQLNLAQTVASKLASQSSTDPDLKKTLETCTGSLKDAISEVAHALFNIDGGHFTDSWNDTMSARQKWFRCVFEFHGNLNFSIPPTLLGPMVNANRLFDATYMLFVLIV